MLFLGQIEKAKLGVVGRSPMEFVGKNKHNVVLSILPLHRSQRVIVRCDFMKVSLGSASNSRNSRVGYLASEKSKSV